MRRLGVAGGVLGVTAALALAACGGGGGSSANAKVRAGATATTATTIINQQGGGSSGGGTTGASNPHGTATSTTHGTATSTKPATSTTRLNTIKPIPGRPAAPTFDVAETYANPTPPTETDITRHRVEGVCQGTPPMTGASVAWSTSNTDFVEINRGSTNYPANGSASVAVPCPDPNVTSFASVVVTAFGPGGEVSYDVGFSVDPNYRP